MANYVGKLRDTAQEELEMTTGLPKKQIKVEKISGTNQPIYTIVRQSYSGPSFDYNAQSITFFVADGSKTVKISDFTNQDFEKVKEKLLAEGIPDDKIKVDYVVSNAMESGKIVSHTFVNQSYLTSDKQAIHFNISQGPQVQTRTMPNLVGQSKEEATEWLERLGFQQGNITFSGLDHTPITAQSILPGTVIIPQKSFVSLALQRPLFYNQPTAQVDEATLINSSYLLVTEQLKALGIGFTTHFIKVNEEKENNLVLEVTPSADQKSFELRVGLFDGTTP